MDERDRDSRHKGPEHASPYPVSRLAPAFQLADLAQEIAQADSMLAEVTSSKLELIATQIRQLQEQARELLRKAETDAKLHRATCRFSKRVGQVYHLYQRADGTHYVSMLSPSEWGTPPHPHIGGFRLEPDMSWTPEHEVAARDASRSFLTPLLRSPTATDV